MSETPPIQLNTPDAGNRGAGEMLRLARESQGLSLDALAMILKVTPVKLAALEEGRLDQLPDANFARALAQTVCRTLRVDAAPVLAALPAARPAPLGSDKPPLNQPFKEARLAPSMFEREGGLDVRALFSFKWLAPLSLLLAAAVVYVLPESVELPAWMHRPASVSDASSSASAADAPASEPEAGVALGEASVAQAASEPLFGASGALGIPDVTAAASAAVAASASVAPVPAPPASVAAPGAQSVSSLPDPQSGAVVLRATEDAWMEVIDGTGVKRLSRLVKAGETLSMGGVPPWSVRIGNVGGVQVSLRGQPVDLSAFARNNVARLELK